MTTEATPTLTPIQLETLCLTLWAELHLPECPVFSVDGTLPRFVSQFYTHDNGFMSKFVETYWIMMRVVPIGEESTMSDLFEARIALNLGYKHGRWMGGGSNGVSTSMYFDRKTSRWVDERSADRMIHDAWKQQVPD